MAVYPYNRFLSNPIGFDWRLMRGFQDLLKLIYCGKMAPVAVHLCCKVETMGCLTGLLPSILSSSSITWFFSLWMVCREASWLASCSWLLALSTSIWLVLFLRLQASKSWQRVHPSLSATWNKVENLFYFLERIVISFIVL